MDPVIQQIARARSIEPHFLARMKTHFVNVVQPRLDEADRLEARVRELEQENAKLRKKGAAA